MRFGGRRWDGGNRSFDNGRWKGGSWDVLKNNVFSKIVSKVLIDEGILGGHGKEVFLFVLMVLGLVGGDMSKDIKTDNWGGGDGGAGNDIGGTVRDVEEREVFNVVEGGPVDSRRWGVLEFGRLRDNGLEDVGGNVKRTWVVPSVVRALEDLEDGGGGICNVLLVDVIKGRPGGDRDVGEGGGGDDSGLGSSEGHFTIQLALL